MAQTTFHRQLKLGSVGRDVVAVKRALSRAGYIRWGKFTPVYGPYLVKAMKTFQKHYGILQTGVYGPYTHRALLPFFDARARKFYEESSKLGADAVGIPTDSGEDYLQLPKRFRSTHPTGGLPGYPAVDVFAKPGTKVRAPADGRIVKLSGRDPRFGGSPGGSYGWSIYLKSNNPNGTYFLTHFGSRLVTLGKVVKEGDIIGTVADSAISGKPGTSHIHEGLNLE
jgi:murein DD-endopeptidase MepM/ murein hydrolase activator NlpD